MSNYTAITTKIRAMRAKLISDEDFDSLADSRSLNDVYQLLSRYSPYKEAFATFQFNPNSREELELAIRRGIRYDFLKLYRFAGIKQRAFLRAYGMQYERIVIKRALRNVEDLHMTNLIMDDHAQYLEKTRHFHMDELLLATDVGGVVNALRDTEYAQLFEELNDLWTQTTYRTYEIESALDKFIEMAIWRGAKRYLTQAEALTFKKSFGAHFDLINLLMIYRLKFIYRMPVVEIKNSILNFGKKLTPEVIDQILLINERNAFQSLVAELGYGELNDAINQSSSIREATYKIVNHLQKRALRQMPNSIFAIISYLEELDHEQERIVQIIERISTSQLTQNRKELA